MSMSFDQPFHQIVFRWLWRLVIYGFLTMGVLLTIMWYVYQMPQTAPGVGPIDQYVEIPRGSTAKSTAEALYDFGVIRSPQTFLISLRASGLAESIKSGTYYFGEAESLQDIIERITSSDYGLPSKTITLFEGEPNFKYAERLAGAFEFISEEEFNRQSKGLEGYLFPDTYTVPERITVDVMIKKLRENFERRIEPLQAQIAASPYSIEEVITMASLVETEAGSASYATKQRVAGILWRRIEIDMLLQADAVFSYIYQEHLPRVLYRHLEVDSPYNVYKHKGLPPGPIANPGLDSIRATLEPINPEGYLFYLTGNDGKFYYAKTLAGHERNRRNHLQY